MERERFALPAYFDAARQGKRLAAVRLLREAKYRVDVDGTELARVWLYFFYQETNQAFAHGLGSGAPEFGLGWRELCLGTEEIADGDAPFAIFLTGIEEKAQFGGTFEPCFVLASEISKLAEVTDNRGVKLLF
jgi:hypothetical protein